MVRIPQAQELTSVEKQELAQQPKKLQPVWGPTTLSSEILIFWLQKGKVEYQVNTQIRKWMHFLSDIIGMIYKAIQVGDMASEYFINICWLSWRGQILLLLNNLYAP